MRYLDLTIEDVKEYVRIDHKQDDLLIDSLITGCKAYLLSYTGLAEEVAQRKAELRIVLLALIRDGYEHRGLVMENMNQVLKNPMAECILNMHSRNGIA